jgi:ATP-dependent Clp protease ATP-binding subunit ClpA
VDALRAAPLQGAFAGGGEAQRLGHDHVGTEHLLLAIVREGEGVADKILERFGGLDEAARV